MANELKFRESLNPYSTGRYSMSGILSGERLAFYRLNPYSTGRYSMSDFDDEGVALTDGVLILILLEDTL